MDISRNHVMGKWRYHVVHFVPPGDRYHHQGHLYYDGRELVAENYNDYYETPFGRLYWWGVSEVTRYNARGWMKTPHPQHPVGDRKGT